MFQQYGTIAVQLKTIVVSGTVHIFFLEHSLVAVCIEASKEQHTVNTQWHDRPEMMYGLAKYFEI